MRDYADLLLLINEELGEVADCQGCCAQYEVYEPNGKCLLMHAADAIVELLAVCRDIAAFVIHYADDDEVSAEVLCRKLHKIGVVEKDGAWWTLPDPPKEVE